MYSVDYRQPKHGEVVVIVHVPASVGHYSGFAAAVTVRESGDWLDRALRRLQRQHQLSRDASLYDNGTAFLGLGAYNRPIHGRWEAFRPADLAAPSDRVRVY